MDIGQTFRFEDSEFAVKRIILPGERDDNGVVFPVGRVDASRFVGEFPDRRIQRGRPKMFDYASVAEILGESTNPTPVESDLSPIEETKVDNWSGQRADPEKIKSFIEKHHTEESTSIDW